MDLRYTFVHGENINVVHNKYFLVQNFSSMIQSKKFMLALCFLDS